MRSAGLQMALDSNHAKAGLQTGAPASLSN